MDKLLKPTGDQLLNAFKSEFYSKLKSCHQDGQPSHDQTEQLLANCDPDFRRTLRLRGCRNMTVAAVFDFIETTFAGTLTSKATQRAAIKTMFCSNTEDAINDFI